MGVPEQAQAAHDFVDQMVERGSREAIELLAVLTEANPTGNDGTAVGTGPLEDLIHEHGDELIDEIELYARTRPPVAQALAVVWVERGHLNADTEDRLKTWVAQFTVNP